MTYFDLSDAKLQVIANIIKDIINANLAVENCL
jgi:hypothetical protein